MIPPALYPDRAENEAVMKYDSDGDGFISATELDQSPGLKFALTKIDRDKDGRLSAKEITDRLKLWRESKIGIVGAGYLVTLDGAPLQGATMTVQPESFLGSAILPAKGGTNEQGWVILKVDDPKLTERRVQGMHLGLYPVEFSKRQGEH